jgi:hypothetical protein
MPKGEFVGFTFVSGAFAQAGDIGVIVVPFHPSEKGAVALPYSSLYLTCLYEKWN